MKTKLQIQIFQQQLNPNYVPKYTNVRNCIQYIYGQRGVRSVWRGLTGTVVRNIPANALFFPGKLSCSLSLICVIPPFLVNEVMKRYFAEKDGVAVKDLPFIRNLMSGACAGLSYWVTTYPLDVIKAKMQSTLGPPIGWLEAAKLVYYDGGIRAFSRGIIPCALRAVPACGMMFATVDIIRGHLMH